MVNASHQRAKRAETAYQAPALVQLGTLHELTLDGCDKTLGSSDGFTFMGQAIVCRNSA